MIPGNPELTFSAGCLLLPSAECQSQIPLSKAGATGAIMSSSREMNYVLIFQAFILHKTFELVHFYLGVYV